MQNLGRIGRNRPYGQSAWPQAPFCLRLTLTQRQEICEVTIVQSRPQNVGYEAARKAMIDSQLRTSGVNAEFVLRRMSVVPREEYVPEHARGTAYMDRAIRLDNGRFLGAPVVQGMMLQEAAPRPGDKALLVDGGSGYMAELLKPLVGELEVVSAGDATAQSRKAADIDLLIVDGAVEQLPDSLTRRLVEDGRIVTGQVQNGLTRLARGRKVAGQIALLPLAEVGMPILPEFAIPKSWSF
ncbi:Protein-L-isoaspartate O-methyltransferase [Croceibacterium atlanticum]|uniref:Protein-L-isoaspartate O-methyltransferase n=1 Tax=Croceibacterium atlanticum TaxID=1267766 RepID=A0A0F7KUM0_9SPHN|nr:Protein-L-isoaspartate O-methyltransferase [Croceibacterium atlanticum]